MCSAAPESWSSISACTAAALLTKSTQYTQLILLPITLLLLIIQLNALTPCLASST
jgi:hypothetical protein